MFVASRCFPCDDDWVSKALGLLPSFLKTVGVCEPPQRRQHAASFISQRAAASYARVLASAEEHAWQRRFDGPANSSGDAAFLRGQLSPPKSESAERRPFYWPRGEEGAPGGGSLVTRTRQQKRKARGGAGEEERIPSCPGTGTQWETCGPTTFAAGWLGGFLRAVVGLVAGPAQPNFPVRGLCLSTDRQPTLPACGRGTEGKPFVGVSFQRRVPERAGRYEGRPPPRSRRRRCSVLCKFRAQWCDRSGGSVRNSVTAKCVSVPGCFLLSPLWGQQGYSSGECFYGHCGTRVGRPCV